MKVLSFGEILWDVYSDKKFLGGASLNFGAHLAKHGEDVYMLSAVGQDDLGAEAIEQVTAWGMKDTYISALDSKETGKCLVTLDEHLIPSYNLLSDVAYDYISCDTVTEAFDVLYFGTLALRSGYNFNALSELLASRKFENVFVDVNIRAPFYSAETVAFAAANATVIKVSLEELPTVCNLLNFEPTEDHQLFAEALAEKFDNLKLVIITLGADGAFAYDCATKTAFYSPCEKTKVVSTVGAGDSFSAAFLHKYMQGLDMPSCLEYANRVARKVVSEMDAVPAYSLEDFS